MLENMYRLTFKQQGHDSETVVDTHYFETNHNNTATSRSVINYFKYEDDQGTLHSVGFGACEYFKLEKI